MLLAYEISYLSYAIAASPPTVVMPISGGLELVLAIRFLVSRVERPFTYHYAIRYAV